MSTPENPTPQPEGWGQPAPGSNPPAAPQPAAGGTGVPNPTDFLPSAVTGQMAGKPASVAGLAVLLVVGVSAITSFFDFVDADSDFYEDAFLDRLLLLLNWGNTFNAVLIGLAVTMFAFGAEKNPMRKLGLTIAMVGGLLVAVTGLFAGLVSLGSDGISRLSEPSAISKLSALLTYVAAAVLAAVSALWAAMLSKSNN